MDERNERERRKRGKLVDPDTTYKEVIEIAEKIVTAPSNQINRDVLAMAQGILGLDDWMKKGGFPPRVWRRRK